MTKSVLTLQQYKWQNFKFESFTGELIHITQGIAAYYVELGTIDFLTNWAHEGDS